MDSIKKYLETFWANTQQYFKINLVALLLIGALLFAAIYFLLPSEKKYNTEINQKDNLVAAQYDKTTDSFKDLKVVNQQQSEAEQLRSEYFIVKLFKFLMLALIVVVITGPLANLLKWSYTKIDFGHVDTLSPLMLAVILIVTFLIEITVYYSIFGLYR